MRIYLIVASALLLSNCAGQMPASVSGGECRVFTDPGFAVRGERLKDKKWIGATQEKGVEVCGWTRPRAEPAVARTRIAPVQAAAPMPTMQPPQTTPAPVEVAPATGPVKRHWYSRVFHRKKPTT